MKSIDELIKIVKYALTGKCFRRALVRALQDVDASVDNINDKVGNINNLVTEDKTNLVSAINEAYNRGGGADENAVHYTADAGKTEAQKEQARMNIGAIGEDDVTEMEIATSSTAVADIASDDKLITPAAVQALIDRILGMPIELQAADNFSWTVRKWDATQDYNVGDAVLRTTTAGTKIHICTNSYIHDSSTSWSHYSANFDDGTLFATLPMTNIGAYITSALNGNIKISFGSKIFHQSSSVVETSDGRAAVSTNAVVDGAAHVISIEYYRASYDVYRITLANADI